MVFWFDVAQLTSSNSTLQMLSDTASLVGTIHSDAAWAALQHGISAAFALAPWQFAGEGVDEGASRLSANFSVT